ncbi:MAG: hypothetical protein FWC70_08910 [Defluviitaleaceae bacterium]|nr:hypothetical protein [Defluviitaleaceae bacterium]
MAIKRTDAIPIDKNIEKSFGLLFVETEGPILIRPIGGNWDYGINFAVEQMNKQYPQSKMAIMEERCDSVQKHFKPCGIGLQRLLL